MDIDELWDIICLLLVSGQKRLAYCFFKNILRAIRLYGLKKVEADVLLSSAHGLTARPNKPFEEIIDKSWGIVLMTYTFGQNDFSKKCFESELRKVYRKTLMLATREEGEAYATISKVHL